jgi:hypothetical protein
MEYFVPPGNIVRTIWGKSDTILFIFAGAAAEFALNKAVDWLYFTGRLPADPIGRLFSTVRYARGIVFAEKEQANRTIDKITQIHNAVENKRGDTIPDWAYRDVLFMLIHYSIAAYELLERKLTADEKEDAYNVFYRMGQRMNIPGLPPTYIAWLPVREKHLNEDLALSKYTKDLFKQYQKHLGSVRYLVLVESQKLVVPPRVKQLLQFSGIDWFVPVVAGYKFARMVKMDALVKRLLLPSQYQKEIGELDYQPAS